MILRNIFILSSFFISSSVMASEDYSVTFKNHTNGAVTIKVINSICMHSTGKIPINVVSGGSESTSIQDKNSGIACINGYKQVFWNVYPNNNQNNQNNLYTQIKFNHEKRGGKWLTQISGQNISATCNGTPCSNLGNNGVQAGGPIIITIGG
ncbi:hypothetical protein PSR30_17090 [Pectobacterium carotovorum subsp. carotovorum]|uniref:hypothetical protein n=1 Tax=Pectobacterium carotovorum TaxID=554 RepID=UPI0023672A0D|nr:hypothetical protein [Pectobacterium carotovorum]WDF98089.1 hypothetical protein PSR30_17090 [Pectobacterium carotovorum subsp. carotovorum]